MNLKITFSNVSYGEIYEKGCERPFPVLKENIPIALTRSGILARAKSGAGKIVYFLHSCLEKTDYRSFFL